MSTSNQTLDFVNFTDSAPSDPAPASSPAEPLKRRVKATGHKHGLALGNAGVVTTAYVQGFGAGFVSAFRD